MSISSEIDRINANVASAYSALEGVGADMPDQRNTDNLPWTVSTIKAVRAVEEKDVNFYDYDGTLLYSYTVAEAQALTELPPAPTPPKDFLVFEEWNWTLAQIKEYNDPVQVGAIYKPVDDKTRAVIQIDEDWQKDVVIHYKQWGLAVTVDWGDGSLEETTKGDYSGNEFIVTHTYAEKGTYTITIVSADTFDLGNTNAQLPFFGDTTVENGSLALREVYVGGKARILSYAFYKARKLETVTLSKRQTAIYSYAFRDSSLRAIVVPSTLTKIDYAAFYYARLLSVCSLSPSVEIIATNQFVNSVVRKVTIPQKVKSIHLYANYYCEKIVLKSGLEEIQSLGTNERVTELTIPETVTSIGSNAFNNNHSMLRLRFLSTTPPTVANANAFTGIPTTCVVEVPTGSFEAYRNATNYASISAQMVGV